MREARKHATHRFELQPEEGADFGARHAKHEFGARVAALLEALRERQEEVRETLFGVHRTEQQHVVVLTDDLARERLHEVRADRVHRDRALFDAGVGNHADFGVFERDQVHRVPSIPSMSPAM